MPRHVSTNRLQLDLKRLPENVVPVLRKQAFDENITVGHLCARILTEYVNEPHAIPERSPEWKIMPEDATIMLEQAPWK